MIYLAPGAKPRAFVGGLCVVPDGDLSALPAGCAGLILAGRHGVADPEAERQVAPLVEEALRRGLTVGAICNARRSFSRPTVSERRAPHGKHGGADVRVGWRPLHRGVALRGASGRVRRRHRHGQRLGRPRIHAALPAGARCRHARADRGSSMRSTSGDSTGSDGGVGTLRVRAHRTRGGAAARVGPRDAPARGAAPHALGARPGAAARDDRAHAPAAPRAGDRHVHGVFGARHGRGAGGRGAVLHTTEVDDELEPLARSFFDRSPHGAKIRLHIGSALDIAPTLGGTFDLVFIDGDKREYPALLPHADGRRRPSAPRARGFGADRRQHPLVGQGRAARGAQRPPHPGAARLQPYGGRGPEGENVILRSATDSTSSA